MKAKTTRRILVTCFLGAACCLLIPPRHAQSKESNPWAKVKAPVPGAPEAIGSYDAGCVRGAQKFPEDYPGYLLMRTYRRRFYAHQDMLRFIENLASQARGRGMGPILVGDAGQPRGGPTLTAHASHQNGLDIDIWYWMPPPSRTLTLKDRNKLSAPNMVIPDFEGLTRNWSPQIMERLKLIAEAPRVERIFVNPVVKREVCKAYAGQPWVQKLRPWWNHDAHCHVRLMCPENNALCKPNDPVPEGDGCGKELEEWFTPEKKAEARYKRLHPQPSAMPVLPAACNELLKR